MPSLHDLQLGFAEAVFDATASHFTQYIRANGLTGARRLQVYRNNVFASLTSALQAVYPVVERLVGEGFFRHAADRYIRRYPSTSGNLHDFGCAFAEFLAGFKAAAALAYLPDVARLEWAHHLVFHAAEHPSLDLSALSAIRPDHHTARFHLHPASRLLASDYPVLRIWEVNQDGYTGDQCVDLAEGGVKLLVLRRGLAIELQTLGEGEYAFLNALAAPQDLGSACEAALGAEANFDPGACLQRHVARCTLVGFS